MREIFSGTVASNSDNNQIIICNNINELVDLSAKEIEFIKGQIENKNNSIHINRLDSHVFVYQIEKDADFNKVLEKARLASHGICKKLNGLKQTSVIIKSNEGSEILYAFAEGFGLSNYQFLKYFSDADKRKNTISTINIEGLSEIELTQLNAAVSSTCIARDFVNEPLSYLTAEQYAHDMMDLGEELGFKVEVFNKSKIQSLKMGGLLAVNLGSVNPPTFSILEWNPENAKNEKPYVLVGKGVVYDTGGVSLKPTANSMDYMKCDMGGSASVVGTIAAIAQAKLPIKVIGLIPATDNRPGGNAYVP